MTWQMTWIQLLDEAFCISLHANAFPPPAMGKIEKPTGLCSLNKATSIEGKALNSKPEECCLGESIVYFCTILLLSADPKSMLPSWLGL